MKLRFGSFQCCACRRKWFVRQTPVQPGEPIWCHVTCVCGSILVEWLNYAEFETSLLPIRTLDEPSTAPTVDPC